MHIWCGRYVENRLLIDIPDKALRPPTQPEAVEPISKITHYGVLDARAKSERLESLGIPLGLEV
jgi:hypothetical protein